MTRLPLLCALLLAPAVASAQEIAEGRYSLDAEACGASGYDGIVTLEDGSLRYWETACALTNPIPVREMAGAVLYDAECGGEGMVETRRLLLLPLADGGLAVAQSGWVNAYARCGD